MRLLDTDIMIDIMRNYKPAIEWLISLDEAPGLPGYVVMELMSGCDNKKEMNFILKQVEQFRIFWSDEADSNRALAAFEKGHLAYNMGILDALIGECAKGLNATLCSFNVRHFKSIINLKIEQPYDKS